MTPSVVFITVISYLALLFTISYIAGRHADNTGFFIGGRKSPWWAVSIATIGATMSGVTFVSVPGMVATSAFGYLQMVLGFTAGYVIIAFVLVPLFYRKDLVSIYGYLDSRFGLSAYKTGAWLFFISKMLGASVRLFLVCIALQLLVFTPFHLPFILNVILTVFLVWIYTFRGGVKSIIWTDVLKTVCIVASVVLCIFYIASSLNLSFGEMAENVRHSSMSRIFFFDDINDKEYFFKQFFAGVFTVIAMTGLDQDMMQRNLSCKNSHDSQKNMLISSVCQLFVILLFLILGVLLYQFAEVKGIQETGDKLFPAVATSAYFPMIVGILFIIGLTASAYSAAGSALTSLTTSFTVDILGIKNKSDKQVTSLRQKVHALMAIIMAITIFLFGLINSTSVIDAVYILASYTYGPILGLFAFGIILKSPVRNRWIPLVVILSPVLCFIIQQNSERWFNGYHMSYELLILNAAFTFIGLCLLIKKPQKDRI
jgi:Na+/proline symporter